MQYVRDCDAADGFHGERLRDLRLFLSNVAGLPEWEFIDTDMETRKVRLYESISTLLDAVGLKTYPSNRRPGFNEVPSEWKDTRPKEYYRTLKEINDLLTGAWKAYDDFVRFGRKRVGDAI